MQTGECIQTIKEPIYKVEILSNNRFLTCSKHGKIKIFSLENFECIRTLDGNAFDKMSNDKLVSRSIGIIRLWDLNSGECLQVVNVESYHNSNCIKVISNEIIALDSSKSYRNGLREERRGNIKICNILTGKCLKTLEEHARLVTSIVVLSREQIASGDEIGVVKIWNVNSGECLKTIKVHTRLINYYD